MLVVMRELLLGVAEPFGEVVLRYHPDFDRHEVVVDAADLIALAIEGAGALELHPALVVPPDDRIFLHAGRWQEPAMDHVGAGNENADLRADRHDHGIVDLEQAM